MQYVVGFSADFCDLLLSRLEAMFIRDISIESPIKEKVRWAENCYQAQKDMLLGDKKVKELLSQFKKAAHASHRLMTESGLENECRGCEEREGGSCCGSGMENRYSGILLLINLLLDRKLPGKRHDPQGCFFLGKTGCSLLARHVICVNYICKKITNLIDTRKLTDLREREGLELSILFFLHERIKEVLKS